MSHSLTLSLSHSHTLTLDQDGSTALHLASTRGNSYVARLLLDHNAELEAADEVLLDSTQHDMNRFDSTRLESNRLSIADHILMMTCVYVSI
jgi:ankyrin repeat protein